MKNNGQGSVEDQGVSNRNNTLYSYFDKNNHKYS